MNYEVIYEGVDSRAARGAIRRAKGPIYIRPAGTELTVQVLKSNLLQELSFVKKGELDFFFIRYTDGEHLLAMQAS